MKQNEIIKNWINYFENSGVNQELIKSYTIYIEKLISNQVPIIFEFNHLALLLGCEKKFLSKIVNSPESFYREFSIPKKLGGERKILAPYPSLLSIQYWIYNNILKNINIHKCAHAYTEKKSIVTNCKIHAGQEIVLKLDLENFFPSINIERIIHLFKSLGYSSNIAFYLAACCCINEELPQGAPTSPILSNIIAKRMDKRLFALATKYELKYTRYADDLVFSGNRIPSIFIKYVHKIISSEGFNLNEKKTRLYQKENKKIITGIVTTHKELKLPRDYKRELKQELNYIRKFGFDSHVSKRKIRKLNYLQSLIGKINFWLQVEPENKFAKETRNILIDEFRKKINITP